MAHISFINGQKGQFGQTNYSAAKAGIIGLTKALAQESAIKGLSECDCPRLYRNRNDARYSCTILAKITEQIPMNRLGNPDEVANTVLFLASDDASFITGTTLSVNGGHFDNEPKLETTKGEDNNG